MTIFNHEIQQASVDLFRWNCQDPMNPRFVMHDVGGSIDDDAYEVLVRKVLRLLGLIDQRCHSCKCPL